MANANGESGCFATVLRHLLCRHGAPTHPSDTIGDPHTNPVEPRGGIPKEGYKGVGLGGRDELGETLSSGRRAGVVARLMGLETLPDTKWVPCAKSPDVFSRSRSVNFMDYLLEVDLSSRRARRHRHRRVKTSASFHEVPVPTVLPLSKEKDFIVVILGDTHEEEAERHCKATMTTKKKKKKKKEKKGGDSSSKEKKVLKLRDEPRTRNRAAHHHKSLRMDAVKQVVVVAAAVDDADGSSPVSVLDKPPTRHRVQGSHNLRKSASAAAYPSRKSSRNLESSSTRVARILDPVPCPEPEVSAKEEIEFPDSGKHLDVAVWKAQTLADEEIGRLRWLSPESPSREEMCRMIERHALDRLLEELVGILR